MITIRIIHLKYSVFSTCREHAPAVEAVTPSSRLLTRQRTQPRGASPLSGSVGQWGRTEKASDGTLGLQQKKKGKESLD